ncbi:hypothetical protein AC578_3388 [Pseudocercospora eumusae]|uniref:DUF4470 domain-containing protein n=1 Tax=Pseudocercospora eumusae TaxID=321146 RepID=A0A139H686_9PEZI|nr:hypothetical protein AC578_3388 [Pseudocercospora eumusae]
MTMETAETSESVRKQGNEKYKAKKFDAAVLLYQKAAELAPDQAAPLSNLSSALFELADYAACDEACNSALALLGEASEHELARQKLYSRLARARFAMKKIDEAGQAVSLMAEGSERSDLEMVLKNQIANRAIAPDAKALHTRLILEHPRYKPMIRTVPEYYSVGHDMPESLYTSDLQNTGRKKISLMFGGIGDARNLHCTLLSIVGDEVSSGGKIQRLSKVSGIGKLYHFTLVDIKPAAIARDLVIFLLLNEIADYEGDMESVIKHKLLPCLYYTYLAPVMPRGVFDVLQKRIKTMVEMLEGSRDLPNFLEVPMMYRPQIIRILKQWQSEASEEYPPARMRSCAVIGRRRAEMQLQVHGIQYGLQYGGGPISSPVPRGCAKEKKFYEATGLLPLTSAKYKLYRPELRACIEGYDAAAGPRSMSEAAAKAIKIGNETWATNVTMVDLDWQRNKPVEEPMLDCGDDIFFFANMLVYSSIAPPRPGGLYDYVEMWFTLVASAFGELKHRLKIEACVGDITAVLEQVRYGVVGHREMAEKPDTAATSQHSVTAGSASKDLSEYPQAYDRIHLSNIPDYIGGTLSSFLYASPITYPGKSSYITSTCLRNPPRFKSIASFDNEYITLSAPSDLAKVFQVSMEPLEDPNEGMATCSYTIWHHHPSSKNLQDLMSREKLETWLFRLFLKIALPVEKLLIQDNALIYSPLNLTIFFRLLLHLHNVGYPSHWLSGIWTEILSGKITTSARPPKTEPLSLKEVKTPMPVTDQSTKPFVAELSTLTTLWQPILPFTLPATNLPLLHEIHKYTIRFNSVSDHASNIPTFILLIHSIQNLSPGTSIRKHLVDDAANNSNFHVITTWTYNRQTRTAKFCLRNDVLFKSRRGMKIAIWRSDDWTRQSSEQDVGKIRDRGVWVGGIPDDDDGDESEGSDEDEDEDSPGRDILHRFMEDVMMGGRSRDWEDY